MSFPSIDNAWVNNHTSEKAVGKTILDQMGTVSGASRVISVASKSIKVGTTMASNPSPTLVTIEQNLGTTSAVLGLFRLPGVTADAVKSYNDLKDPNNTVRTERKVASFVSNIFGAISAYARAIAFVTLNSFRILPIVASMAEFGSDGVALPQEIDDLTQTSKLAELAQDGELKEFWTHSRNYHILSVVKTVVSIVSAILGLALVAFIPIAGFALIGLSITLLALTKDYYKALSKYPVISFGKPIPV